MARVQQRNESLKSSMCFSVATFSFHFFSLFIIDRQGSTNQQLSSD